MRYQGPFAYIIMLGASLILSTERPKAYYGVAEFDVVFKGRASGGTLLLVHTRNRNARYIRILTSPGESSESVAHRLSDAVNAQHSIGPESPEFLAERRLWVGGYQASASGSILRLPGAPDDYILAGTESGLGIPNPPLSLSCSYDEENDKVMLRWINPPTGYDFILAKCFWTDLDHVRTERVIGTSTSFTIGRKKVPLNVEDMDFRVFGFRENIPSNAAAIHASAHCQKELYGIPFTQGIAPNWTLWSTAAKVDEAAFEEGKRYTDLPVYYNPAKVLHTKPYYQIIKAPPKGVVHGVYRKFLGLMPGHTYRLTACLTTLDMDSVKGDWALSFHATATPNGKDLSTEQLAGLTALPDGQRGPEVGRIAFYGPANTTTGDFALVFSGKDAPGGFESSHITLPPGVDTITVWVRFNCSDPNGKVGFSGVKLEDLTAIKNPKSPAEIIAEENAAEVELLKWIEKASSESQP